VHFERGGAVDSGAIWVQRLRINSFVQTIRGSFVQQIDRTIETLWML
jgi:hypothetical protein